MLDLVAFTKPVLDEITGQDVRTWHSGPSVLAANWQVPEFDSRIWRVRTLTIAFTHDVMNQLMHADQQDLCQLQCMLDRFLRAQLGMHAQADRGDRMLVITVDHLGVAS
ncbi:MAG: hypothetical protein QM625_23260 [Ralstonia sp.]|jgi:hypothetical protein|uniref:Uncharacterized protein n=4 Tax=Ralstonia TaxID=48736 RepID=A0AAD2BNQ6_9RALS|nr:MULTISPECIES: hypothetical protein [Ralstonia]MEA3271331.1 hypothetical protein [Pseudomonadota bacterium]EFP66036.1 hypothetical protein HMPREF1004_02045 [Ralstonia pickettii]EGY63034.1 hypothetical protein HMPREF0989_03327 [Ralstonia sp. 5_2_56FAA]ENZ78516.1 hypothetical protein OR214_01934 [Ralstonia pickettii OR214]KFL21949.1 hypothetical protein DP23_494 [Ralstonia pickettii]